MVLVNAAIPASNDTYSRPTRQRSHYDTRLKYVMGLITSAGWPKRAVYSEFMRALPPPTKVISDVSENPKVSEVCALSDKLGDAEIVVAIVGGSVIDAVKGAVALGG